MPTLGKADDPTGNAVVPIGLAVTPSYCVEDFLLY